MSDQSVLFARQPIYDQKKRVYAYELLFRPSSGKDIDIAKLDGNFATGRVIINAFDETDIDNIRCGKPYFINFTRPLLFETFAYDPRTMVIEILEDIEIDRKVIDRTRQLRKMGFRVALDDFVPSERYDDILPHVDFVKLELPALSEKQIETTVRKLRNYSCKVVAEKVETYEEFDFCKKLGCDLFQGYFLSKPISVKGKALSSNKISVMRLISEIQDPDAGVPQIVDIINADPTLSYKLLKLANSAAFRRLEEVKSINIAVMMLGLEKIKSWATLLSFSKLEDKSPELLKIAIFRAYFCERVGERICTKETDRYFMIGLLSTLNLFFDRPIADLIEQIPLDERAKGSILKYQNKAGLALHTVKQYEMANWNGIHWPLLAKLGINEERFNQICYEATSWVEAHEF